MLATTLLFGAIATASASAQDFNKSYQLEPNGEITVASLSGDVRVTGYDGSSVVVTATIKGRDADRVTILDRSGAGVVDVGVDYPKNCNCDATVDFDVRVPNGTPYRYEKIVSMSGDVEIANVTGEIHATSMSGDVRVRDVAGTVEATAMSGDVHARITRLVGNGELKFTTMSGDVEVSLPSDLDANVSIATLSGSISNDFGLSVSEKKYGPGQTARGQLGDGSRTVTLKSLSGNARLLRN
jgi:DUF4097 and DUF4098 domain-containing protein YvlB